MLAVIEQVNTGTLFRNLYNKCVVHGKTLTALYDWCKTFGFDALECHLQNEFPNGTDIDEYESYIMDNAKEILADLKGE